MDSLAFEPVTGFVKFLLPRANDEAFARATFLLLSKTDSIGHLVEGAKKYPWATQRVVPSWSVNTPFATRRYELNTPPPEHRLKAARRLQDLGYPIRLRIDPLIPYPGADADYCALVDAIYRDYRLDPRIVTLGSLRYEKMVTTWAGQRFPGTNLFDLPIEKRVGDKQRLTFNLRHYLYQRVIDRIRFHRPSQNLGLCKEQQEMWEALKLKANDQSGQACNCVSEWSFNKLSKRRRVGGAEESNDSSRAHR